jgi:hypothetical protein
MSVENVDRTLDAPHQSGERAVWRRRACRFPSTTTFLGIFAGDRPVPWQLSKRGEDMPRAYPLSAPEVCGER